MKIISLNAWGGKVQDGILGFFEKYRDADIFLLQEVFHHATPKTSWSPQRRELFSEISDALPGHQGYFAPVQDGEWGLAIFIKKEIPVRESGDIFVHRWRDAMEGNDGSLLGRNIQYLKISVQGKEYAVINFHGIWNGKHKDDSPERLEQSRNIKKFLNGLNGERAILCGDFNLKPGTESLAIVANGMRDLIKEYGITSTRSHLYPKEVRFADYAFVSPGVDVKSFAVLDDVVSDHLALSLECE